MVKRAIDFSVLAAVDRDLAALAKLDPVLAKSSLAATARALARELDEHNSATSKSMCAKELRDTMKEIRSLAPEKQARDDLDELGAQRARRRAGRAAS